MSGFHRAATIAGPPGSVRLRAQAVVSSRRKVGLRSAFPVPGKTKPLQIAPGGSDGMVKFGLHPPDEFPDFTTTDLVRLSAASCNRQCAFIFSSRCADVITQASSCPLIPRKKPHHGTDRGGFCGDPFFWPRKAIGWCALDLWTGFYGTTGSAANLIMAMDIDDDIVCIRGQLVVAAAYRNRLAERGNSAVWGRTLIEIPASARYLPLAIMTGSVYSALRAIKLTFAVRPFSQPSQLTSAHVSKFGGLALGAKKRILIGGWQSCDNGPSPGTFPGR